MDDVQIAGCPATPNTPTPDCNYSNMLANGYTYRAIPCTRDLEDYARLWVCGITSNLLAALPAGCTITLNWGDVGNPNSANPIIDLFQAADANGGMGYLTNATIAAEQTNAIQCRYVGRLGPGQSIQLNTNTFANNWAGNYFIWCGVSNGTGGLNLTIANSSGTVLAQTTAYIQIEDIKQMYERWTVGDNPNIAPTNVAVLASDGLPAFTMPFQYVNPPSANTPYILLVHGWNVAMWDKDRFAETAFKRLYWQGYQGRFGEFRWPTTYLTPTGNSIADDAILASIYDPGEYNAWNSAVGLMNKLSDLNQQYPGNVYLIAHSMGNVVAGEALRLAAQNGLGQLVNTYVASQAAVPGHCYDSALSGNDLLGFVGGTLGPTTANIYNNWLATNSAAAGRRINFYNTNDYALNSIHWQLDEELKPDSVIGIHPPYGYSGSPNDNPPLQNGFYGTSPPYIGFDLTLYLGNTSSVSNRYEITAFAAEPRSLAMGATPDVLTLTSSLDLRTIWPSDPTGNNYVEHFWHSAEFRGDSIQQWGYWNTLLFSPTVGFNISSP
jgi:pimeloyl-ACP methyl ester carboxylesterase